MSYSALETYKGRIRGSQKTTRRRDKRTQVQEKTDPGQSEPEKQHSEHTATPATDPPCRKQDAPRIRRVRRPELQGRKRRHRHRPSQGRGRTQRRGINLQLLIQARWNKPIANKPSSHSGPGPRSHSNPNSSDPSERP